MHYDGRWDMASFFFSESESYDVTWHNLTEQFNLACLFPGYFRAFQGAVKKTVVCNSLKEILSIESTQVMSEILHKTFSSLSEYSFFYQQKQINKKWLTSPLQVQKYHRVDCISICRFTLLNKASKYLWSLILSR